MAWCALKSIAPVVMPILVMFFRMARHQQASGTASELLHGLHAAYDRRAGIAGIQSSECTPEDGVVSERSMWLSHQGG